LPNCIETITCPLTNFLDFIIQPLIITLGDWFYVIVWAFLVGLIQIRVKEPMMTGIVGVIVIGSLMSNNLLTGATSNTLMFFVVMMGASIGFVVYSLWRKYLPNG
jgi:hypothetical protein